jgi:hypothetical protein
MDKKEFIRRAVLNGYATERVAEMYAEGQDIFDQSDLMEVYAIKADPISRDSNWISLGNVNYKKRAIFYD